VRRGIISLSSAILAALSGATGTGLVISEAAAQVARRDEDEDAQPPLLIARSNDAAPILLAGHRSHRSHASHRSHVSGHSSGHSSHASHRSHVSSTGGGGGGGTYVPDPAGTPSKPVYVEPAPRPRPPKPARVSLAAFPGGKIYVDGKLVGTDTSSTLTLKPGTYVIKVVNRFMGEHSTVISVSDGQTGTVVVKW
jgi:hypothetical protein